MLRRSHSNARTSELDILAGVRIAASTKAVELPWRYGLKRFAISQQAVSRLAVALTARS